MIHIQERVSEIDVNVKLINKWLAVFAIDFFSPSALPLSPMIQLTQSK